MTLDQGFSARHVPWQKIGTIIDDPNVKSAEAALLGGIDFNVDRRRSGFFTDHQQVRDDDGNVSFVDRDGEPTDEEGYWTFVPSRDAIVREGTDRWFSYVSDDYRPVQFSEAFEFMDGINPRYVAAGALSAGKQGFMIVQLPDHDVSDIEIDGTADPHQMYVVLQTSHDLSKGIKISVMMLRNLCMNMLALPSFTQNVKQTWSIPHIGDPHKKLAQAQATLQNASAYQQSFERIVRSFASVHVDSDGLRSITRRVLPDRPTRDDQVSAIVDRFENASTVGFRGTGWGALNALSDYMQWGRRTATRTAQSEFLSPLEGDTAKYVNRMAHLVMSSA